LQLIKDNLQACKLLEGVISRAQDSILVCIDRKSSKAFGLSSCYQSETKIGEIGSGIQSTQFFDTLGTKFQDAKKRGVRIRFLTEVTKENLDNCSKLFDFGDIRQIKNTFGNFILTEKEFLLAFANSSHDSEVLYSNEQELIIEQRYIFENLWANNSYEYHHTISPTKSVKIEEIRILYDPTEIRHKYIDLIKSATSEISIIIATPNALRRNYTGGIIGLLRDAAKRKKVKVNLIVPDISDQIEKSSDEFTQISSMATIPNFQVKTIIPVTQQIYKIQTTFLLVDKEFSFIIDINDDMQQNFLKAVGYAIYSASESRTESYNFIFDTIWKQADLQESLIQSNKQLSEANKRLKLYDKLQKDFVNMAAHELRTPAQSIIGYAELLNQSETRNRKYEQTLLRNADRLYRLSADILDVARIESETLKLDKSEFDINEKIRNVINDVSQASKSILEKKKIEIIFKAKESSIIVYADKVRIFQVISNLLNNAIKFTENGTISFTAEKNSFTREAIITITDTGSGIVSELLPTIFERFTGKSLTGMGVGLFIAKSVVEAHGGKIQACNNSDGKGATFTFTLPL
jgi:signal transduction histidine kinase